MTASTDWLLGGLVLLCAAGAAFCAVCALGAFIGDDDDIDWEP